MKFIYKCKTCGQDVERTLPKDLGFTCFTCKRQRRVKAERTRVINLKKFIQHIVKKLKK